MNENQPSITEWLARLGDTKKSDALREYDNKKSERLEVLYQLCGIPYERPIKLEARDLTDNTLTFQAVMDQKGDELCALRLIPKKVGLPKLRNRGLTLKVCYETWYLTLDINPDDYEAHVCPHNESLEWSSTFVVKGRQIFGEIITGLHNQLTHGDFQVEPIRFSYDFKHWTWSKDDSEAKSLVKRMTEALHITDASVRKSLTKDLDSTFTHDYLEGYFEVTVWPGSNINFIDYNNLLLEYFDDNVVIKASGTSQLQGFVAYSGKAQGKAVIVDEKNVSTVNFPAGSILVSDNTDVRFLPLMQRAAAIITNRGGVLSHAAIIARELKIPCIVGTKNATEKITNGKIVRVNADNNTIHF